MNLDARTTPAAEGCVSFSERLGVVRELIGTLDIVTRDGQTHVMHRVLAILRGEILQADLPLTAPEAVAATDALAELEHEAGRIAPAPRAFNRHAEIVVGILRHARRARSGAVVAPDSRPVSAAA